MRRYQVTVWRELSRVFIHLTDQSFAARFSRVTKLFENGINPRQQRTVERIIISQQMGTGWYGLEHFEVFGLVFRVVIARLDFRAGQRSILAVFYRISENENH